MIRLVSFLWLWFSVCPLWWRRIRGLCKLPDGRDWLRGKLDLVPMGQAMLCKSLMLKGGTVFLPCYLTWGQTMVEVIKKMTTYFQRSPALYALPHSVPPTLQQATTDGAAASTGYSWTLTGKSGSVSCGVTAPFSWVLVCTRLFVPSKSLFPQSCVSSGISMVGIMVTFSKGAYVIPSSTASRAPAPAVVHCWSTAPQEIPKHRYVSVSVGSLGPGVHKVCLSPLSISGRYGVWF